MTRDQISLKVREIIAKSLFSELDSIKETDHLVNDLGADSLDRIEITMDIEEAYFLDIHDEEVEGLATVSDLIDLVEKLRQEKAT